MKKSLSILLAIAMVFTMFSGVALAADKTAGEQLKDLGIINGTLSGDLQEDSKWDRQDVAVILSRLLDVEADAKATPKAHTFTDVTDPAYDGYLTWAQAEGYLEGHSEVRFGYNEAFTNHQFVAVMLRALGYDTTGANYEGAKALAVEVGLVAEGTDFTSEAVRGTYYTVVLTTLNTEVKDSNQTLGASLGLEGFVAEVPEIAASAVGAKKLAVTFSSAVDEDEASFAVKKGSITVNQKEVTYSDDMKTATIETSTKLTEGDYTITVTGVADDALEVTVTAENEKVTNIEFTSEKAPLSGASLDLVVYGHYKVYNQYEENVTNSTSITATAGKGNAVAANGTVTITATNAFNLSEKVHLSLLHNTTGTFASALLEVSPQSAVAEVEIVELHEHDDNALVAGESTPSNYWLVVKATDQYGNSVAAGDIGADVITSVSNPSLFQVAEINVGGDDIGHYTVEGDDTVLKLDNNNATPATIAAGTNTVFIISKTTGTKSEINVTVKEAAEVDELTISSPEIAVAGDKVKIPFTAIDQFGEEMKKEADLTAGITSKSTTLGTIYFEQDHVAGEANLILDVASETVTSAQSAFITIVSGTGNVSQLTVSVQPNAKPVVISGTTDKFTSTLAVGATSELKHDKIVVKDQYNRDFTIGDVLGTASGDYRISVAGANSKVGITGTGSAIIDATGDIATFTGLDKGTASITLTIIKGDSSDEIANSAYTFTSRTVAKDEISSYEVDEIGTIYGGSIAREAGHDKSISVNGFLSNNTKVAIPSSYYSVVSDVYNTASGKIEGDFGGAHTGDDVTKTVVVNINADGGMQVKVLEVVVSETAPAPTTLSVTGDHADVTKESDSVISVALANIVGTDAATTKAKVDTITDNAVKVVDQYGVEIPGGISGANVFASKTNAELFGLAQGDTFNVTAVTGGKYITFKVIVK